MEQIYCDNASTSFPKAPGLGTAIGKHIDSNGFNISRGGYGIAYRLEREILETRLMICRMFGVRDPRNIVFVPGATAGLNMLLKGVLRCGDHVITTSMEHNSVTRPLAQLATHGVIWDEAECDGRGELDKENIKALIRPETRLVTVIHGSNVCGTQMPVNEIGRICADNEIFFAVDASQTAGSVKIDMEDINADCIIFPGHKGLMGPQGIGCMLLSDRLAESIEPLILGGTGSVSEADIMPTFLPDRMQAGTLNIPGIIGLKHALGFIENEGLEAVIEKKTYLSERFIEGILNIDGIRVIGQHDIAGSGVVSIVFEDMDNAEAAFLLERDHGILTRCGLHCAPHAHRTLGTFPGGTVRFSFGYFNTAEQVANIVCALKHVTEISR